MPSPDSNPDQSPENTHQNVPPGSGNPSILVDLGKPTHVGVSTGYKPGTGKQLVLCAAVSAVVLAGAFFVVHHRRSRQDAELDAEATTAANTPASVSVVTIKYGSDTESFKLPGQTRAWYETTIYARVSGYLGNWKADIGDHVKVGDVLATIETPELDDQLNAAEAKLAATQSEVTVAQAATDFAKTTRDRYWTPRADEPPGVVSEQEKDSTQADYASSVARLEAAKSQVKLDEANVANLKDIAKFKEVRAPFDGVITARRIDIGDLITSGSSASTTSLYSIAQYDQIRVFVAAPQDAAIGLVTGMPATVTIGEHADRQFQGKIERAAEALDPASLTMRVEVDVANADAALLPGMSVSVSFELKQKPLLEVPASALMFRVKGQQVAVVDPNGKISFHNVTIGRQHDDYVDIVSGLSEGDRVALNLSNQIADGDLVTANDQDKNSPTAAPATSSGTSHEVAAVP